MVAYSEARELAEKAAEDEKKAAEAAESEGK